MSGTEANAPALSERSTPGSAPRSAAPAAPSAAPRNAAKSAAYAPAHAPAPSFGNPARPSVPTPSPQVRHPASTPTGSASQAASVRPAGAVNASAAPARASGPSLLDDAPAAPNPAAHRAPSPSAETGRKSAKDDVRAAAARMEADRQRTQRPAPPASPAAPKPQTPKPAGQPAPSQARRPRPAAPKQAPPQKAQPTQTRPRRSRPSWSEEERAELRREADGLAKTANHADYLDHLRAAVAFDPKRAPAEIREVVRLYAARSDITDAEADRFGRQAEQVIADVLGPTAAPDAQNERLLGDSATDHLHGTAGAADQIAELIRIPRADSPDFDEDHIDLIEDNPDNALPPREDMLPDSVDWDEGLRTTLTDLGVPEEAAEVGVFLIEASPVGTGLDVAEGLYNAGAAFDRGDVEGGLTALGEAGLSAAKIGKVKKYLDKGGAAAAKHLAKLMPDTASTWLAKGVAGQARKLGDDLLAGDVLQKGIARGLKNGMNPGDALAYGVFSAHAENALGKAASEVLGKTTQWSAKAFAKLPPAQQAKVRKAAQTKLAAYGKTYLGDVSDEAKEKAVGYVLEELFPQAEE